MRVLLLCKGLGLGGMERLLAASIPHLDRDRFDYEVAYLLPWKDDLVPEFEAADIPVHCLNIRQDLDPRAFPRLRSLIKDRGIELIHSHSPHPAVIGRLAARGTGVRAVVHTEHSLPESRRGLTQAANRLTYPLNDLTIAVSNQVAAAISHGRLMGPKRLRVIHGGLDVEAIEKAASEPASVALPADAPIVGNLAHLRSQKGIDTFIRAAAIVAAGIPDTRFVVVGREKQAGYQAEMERLAHSLEVGDRVTFLGFQRNPYPLLSRFDVFMMSSRFEGFPVALLEAMALGKPVVATAVGGVPEAVIHGENGLLADPDDYEALAEHTLRLLGDPDERDRLAANAHRTASADFSIETMVRRVEDAYKEVE